MQIQWRWLVIPSLLIAASGCPDVKVDEDEIGSGGPIVEFDPGNRIIPFPNNLLLDRTTGKVNVPASCGEGPASMATRVGVVNKLDGFGTFETTMTLTFSKMPDMASLADKIVVYKRAAGGTAVDPATSTTVPVVLVPSMTARFPLNEDGSPNCTAEPEVIPQVVVVAARPLDQKSTYVAAILSGPTAEGAALGPSFTWSLVRNAENPVEFNEAGDVTANRTPLDPKSPDDLATLQGLDLLWKAHAQGLAFLVTKDHQRDDILLAWEFNTQTVQDPLDPAVTDSPAAAVNKNPVAQVVSLTATINRTAAPYVLCDAAGGGPGTDDNVQCFLKISLGASQCPQPGCPTSMIYPLGNATCATVGCAAVGDVYGGAFLSKQYMSETPNAFDPAKPIPGPWSDPVRPTMIKNEAIQFIAIAPAGTVPAAGYPSIVYGHGLGSSKKTILAIGPQIAATGAIAIGIDFVAHDSRAVRTSDAAALGCAGTPDPTVSPQCFAPFLSTNLATTRDGIRQSVLDIHGLVETIKACGAGTCATTATRFAFDPTHISYLGISLGGIMGSTAVATKPDFKAATINVPGHGWVDILEKTSTRAIKCPLVNGLIDAGILTGDKSNATFTTGLCTTDDWLTQAAYRQFATIGRWILDPADPANFASRLAQKRILIQKVEGDAVVPNFATDTAAALTGLATGVIPGRCAPASATFPPTMTLNQPGANKFVNYTMLGPGICNDGVADIASPGTIYEHASLLRPVAGFCTTNTMNRCNYFSPTVQSITDLGNAQCNAAQAGDTCNGSTVVRGQLSTKRLQTDALTFLTVNR